MTQAWVSLASSQDVVESLNYANVDWSHKVWRLMRKLWRSSLQLKEGIEEASVSGPIELAAKVCVVSIGTVDTEGK